MYKHHPENDHQSLRSQIVNDIDYSLLCGHFPDMNRLFEVYGGANSVIQNADGVVAVSQHAREIDQSVIN
jgi:hypothetical protein